MKAVKYNAVSEPALRIELSIDERHALKSAAERLRSEFAGAFDAQTVERLVESS
jgi:arsenate reductase (thioredoxin)